MNKKVFIIAGFAIASLLVVLVTWRHLASGASAHGGMLVSIPTAATNHGIQVDHAEAPPSVLPSLHECLTTEDGLRLKVITAQPGLRCLDAVENGRLTGEELRLFQELFVLDVIPAEGTPEWYLVSKSPRKAHKLGFLRAGTVAEWPTRLGLRPILPVLFYSERSHAEELARTGKSDVDPIGRASPDGDRKYLPWPIVASSTLTNESGQVVEVALLNLLGERRIGDDVGVTSSAVVRYSDSRKVEITEAVELINLAYCLDNTKSTTPFVPQIIAFSTDSAGTVRERRPKLRLALTLYRDDVPGLTWAGSVTKTLWSGTPQLFEQFIASVKPINAAEIGSDGASECAYQGLMETLTATRWDELSHKVIVWIGDNSAHPKGTPRNPNVGPDDIIREAKKRGVVIHAVAIHGGGGDDEQELHLSQCREITTATGGEVYNLSDAHRLAGEIAKAVQTEHAIVRKNSQDLQRIAGGDLTVADYMASKDREELSRRYQFVRLLESAGVDLEGFAPNQPSFVRGWVPTQLPGGGQPLFERMVYVSRVELDVLLSELNHLCALLRHDSTKGLLKTFDVGLGARVGDQSFFSGKREGDIPFDAFMAARGIPMRTGITMKSRDEILGLSPEEKLLLKARLINEVIPKLTNARSSTSFSLTGDFDFGWIPENLLP